MMEYSKRIFKNEPEDRAWLPLDTVCIQEPFEGRIEVLDGQGIGYAMFELKRKKQFIVSGALGEHRVVCDGKPIGSFFVDCETAIDDQGGVYKKLLATLRGTLSGGETFRVGDAVYHVFVRWLRDHVHTLKGMQYFESNIKSAIDLFRDTQRKDGMIWDNLYPRTKETNFWEMEFAYGDFIRVIENGTLELKRIPVEADVEYLFVEGLYRTWKATGDTAWMRGGLDSAIAAMNYCKTSPYRWSKKLGLIKRGYTIDTWDFQNAEDKMRAGQGPMVVKFDKTRFGIMHGDNTGYAMACRQLAEMLCVGGRDKEAAAFQALEKEIRQRLDKLSWNGQFFTHHVPENPRIKRDLGVDEKTQVSLSNAYNLSRGIRPAQAKAILETYQRIRREMPKSSPGEFYMIYPPFGKGFEHQGPIWEYMNGGVTTIVAGELAKGAFEHGAESYGVEILNTMQAWADRHDGYLHCALRGCMPKEEKLHLKKLNIKPHLNADVRGDSALAIPWTGEGDNDLRKHPSGTKTYHGVSFDITDPAKNQRKTCVAIGSEVPFAQEIRIPTNGLHASVYLLHAVHGKGVAGTVTFTYADESEAVQYIKEGEHYGPWWMPIEPAGFDCGNVCNGGKHPVNYRVAWRGTNPTCSNVGNYICGINNPHPDRKIEHITLRAGHDNACWFVFAATASKEAVRFPETEVSYGIPDNWGAAAVTHALIEGLAGTQLHALKDPAVRICPRWDAAGVKRVTVCTKLPASNTYVRYQYTYNEKNQTLRLKLAGQAEKYTVEILLPSTLTPRQVRVNGKDVPIKIRQNHCILKCSGRQSHSIEVQSKETMFSGSK